MRILYLTSSVGSLKDALLFPLKTAHKEVPDLDRA